MLRARFSCFVALILAALAGCGKDGPQVVTVSGTLLHKGKGVPNAMLNFLPEKGRQSWAQTDSEGRFKINYDPHQDGAVVGKHKVWIEFKASAQTGKEIEPGEGPRMPKDTRALFDKYSYANSKLEVTIERSTSDLKITLE